MTEAHPPTLGLLLAGGLARRMGGGDKPLRTIGGRPILTHVVARAAPQCDGLLLNANGDPARFAAYGLPVVADDVPDFAGPLAGILAGLDWAARQRPGIDWVVSIAADTPFLPSDLVARLHGRREAEGAELACAASGGRTHPVIGLWPVALRADLRRALVEAGERKIDRFTGRYRTAIAEWPVRPYDPFFNANAPDDLAAAERIAASLQQPEPARAHP
ncbi:molybdenum cofactor guanylyltransferase MobA [Chelatococcus sp. SYSU_G07232]|uniref:Molybdenum cofactor guanylyltransferase n=1 Tax=Chelatococcus albus TaxID=3047466 RepID=A0ABT7AKV7_9HYPH|nr:molybdenum cofactor guanylyltransferase MobA [Chelatococcus sp. SYSU_G07232]MDJ1159607.1 molybdenum cofactor guanylyltransferase MobA [Chelatococcus sp. SYSU_G07232]